MSGSPSTGSGPDSGARVNTARPTAVSEYSGPTRALHFTVSLLGVVGELSFTISLDLLTPRSESASWEVSEEKAGTCKDR